MIPCILRIVNSFEISIYAFGLSIHKPANSLYNANWKEGVTVPELYIASEREDGGVYHYHFKNGALQQREFTPLHRPMYLLPHQQSLYALLRCPFEGGEEQGSGLTSLTIGDDGVLTASDAIVSTKGRVACHLAVFDEQVVVANYVSGNVFMTPDKMVQHEGSGPDVKRQDAPHTHCVTTTPDGRYVCITDLGTDSIVVYDATMRQVSSVSLPSGIGPRHLLFHEGVGYCVCELQPYLCVLDYADGVLTYRGRTYLLPTGDTGFSHGSAIREHGGRIYVSNRFHDTISVLNPTADGARLVDNFFCGGKTPRDFHITGNTLVCANLDSDTVTFFDLSDGIKPLPELTLHIPQPICVAVVE